MGAILAPNLEKWGPMLYSVELYAPKLKAFSLHFHVLCANVGAQDMAMGAKRYHKAGIPQSRALDAGLLLLSGEPLNLISLIITGPIYT